LLGKIYQTIKTIAMKKLSTLLACLFVSIAAIGQFEWVFDNGIPHDYVHKFVKTKKNQYVILHGKTDYCCPEKLTILDNLGNTLFNFTASGDENSFSISFFRDVIEMTDSTISLATQNSVYDPLSMQGFLYGAVLKLDLNWTAAITAENLGNEYDFGASLSDGSFVLMEIYDSQIWRMSNYGEQIWEMWLPGYDLLDLEVKNNDTILVATGQGLIVMDKDGNMIAEYSSLVFNQIKTDGQGGIIGVKNDSICLLSSDYSLSAVAGFQGGQIRDFSVEGNMIAVLTSSGHVYRYDGTLSLMNDFQLFNDGEFSYLAIGNDRLLLAGMERYGGLGSTEGTRTVFVKEYSFEGDGYDLSKDVGVLGVAHPQETQVINSGSNFKVIFKNIRVTVKNFGNHPVESLYLRSQQFKSDKFNNLGLAPAGEVELTIDDIERTYTFDPAGLELNLCFWTSHPDLLMDLDAENDSYCADFLVNNQDVLTQNSFMLYPNPSRGMLNMQWKGQAASKHATCRIINAEGKVMRQMEIDHRQEIVSISVEDWPSGVYFVQFFADGSVFYAGRFIVIK
jgi:hypothetical protein